MRSLKIWGAADYRQDNDRFYWGTPIVPANGVADAKAALALEQLFSAAARLEAAPLMRAHAVDELQHRAPTITAAPTSEGAVVFSGTSPVNTVEGARLAMTPTGTGSTNIALVRPDCREFSPARRASTANAWRWITPSGSTATSPTSPSTQHRRHGLETNFVATVAASSNCAQRLAGHAVLQRLWHRSAQSGPRPLWPRADEHIFTRVNTTALSFEDRLKLTSTFYADQAASASRTSN